MCGACGHFLTSCTAPPFTVFTEEPDRESQKLVPHQGEVPFQPTCALLK